jgi:phage-related protein
LLAFEGPKIFQNNFSTYTVIGMLPNILNFETYEPIALKLPIDLQIKNYKSYYELLEEEGVLVEFYSLELKQVIIKDNRQSL